MCRKEKQARKRFVNLMKSRNQWVTECFWCETPLAVKELIPKEFKSKSITGNFLTFKIKSINYKIEKLSVDHFLKNAMVGTIT